MQGCLWIGWVFLDGESSQWCASMLLRTALCLPVSLLVFSATSTESFANGEELSTFAHFIISSLSLVSVLLIGPPFSSW